MFYKNKYIIILSFYKNKYFIILSFFKKIYIIIFIIYKNKFIYHISKAVLIYLNYIYLLKELCL